MISGIDNSAMFMKLLAFALLIFAMTASAVTMMPLDEPEWPTVVPEFKNNIFMQSRGVKSELGDANNSKPDFFADRPFADVRMIAGAPQFHLNGKPFFALWGGLRDCRRPDKLARHSSAPINIITVYSYTTKGSSSSEWWPSVDGFDPEVFDRQAERYGKESNPDTYFMWDIVLYPPKDWVEANPNDICMDDTGKPVSDGPAPYSFASVSAIDVMEQALVKALRYLESSKYANRIIGYRINSGHHTEWAGWVAPSGHFTDFSPVAQKAFAQYVKKRHPGWSDASVPTVAERSSADAAVRAKCAAFYDFYSRRSADNVIRLMRKAREVVGDGKLLGTYMGYLLASRDRTTQMRAYYALKYFLDARAVDFLMSPQPYSLRRLGDTCGDMKPFATLAANGVVPIIENDVRTSNGPYNGNKTQMLTLAQSVAAIRRDAGIALCRRQPIFFYALREGTEFDFPEFADDMAVLRKVAEHCLCKGVARHAEVAYVVSEEMMKLLPLPDNKGRRSAGFSRQYYKADGTVGRENVTYIPGVRDVFMINFTTLARAGAPVDYVSAEDLKDHPGKYKLYIEPDIIAGKMRFRTASGITEGDTMLKIDTLREIYAREGLHIYTAVPDPIEANDNLFTLHARYAGKKTVRLPKRTTVLDVFNRCIIAKNVEEFSFEAPLHSSWLFYVGDDAETVAKLARK